MASEESPALQADAVLLDLLGVLVQERAELLSQIDDLRKRSAREVAHLRHEARVKHDLRTLTGDSPRMKQVRQAINQVAATDSTVLILGETGTGKELVARAIHQLSPRRDQMLVSVNCGALGSGVIASELFGHEVGAFTGATRRRIGRFEVAHRGTLFLDEIAEVPPDVQVMLLRVLQERMIERVGGNAAFPVDVRIIAATHQDLTAKVAEGTFRADLFYRLNVFPIHVPPLRDRPQDIPLLVRHFIHQCNRRLNKRIEGIVPSSLKLLGDYPWPGNVRELENIIERATIVAEGAELAIDPSWLPTPRPAPGRAESWHDMERQTIEDALRRCGGKVYGTGGAAAALRLKPTTLYGKMRKLGIPRSKPI